MLLYKLNCWSIYSIMDTYFSYCPTAIKIRMYLVIHRSNKCYIILPFKKHTCQDKLDQTAVIKTPQISVAYTTKFYFFSRYISIKSQPGAPVLSLSTSHGIQADGAPAPVTLCRWQRERRTRWSTGQLLKLLPGSDTCHFCSHFLGQNKSHGHTQCLGAVGSITLQQEHIRPH